VLLRCGHLADQRCSAIQGGIEKRLALDASGKFCKFWNGASLRASLDQNVEASLQVNVRPVVFRAPGSLLYADNCKDLQAAAQRGEVRLVAWTRGGYPGIPLEARLPGLCTAGFWDAARPQNWGLKRHCNEGVKIAYVARGTVVLDVDGVSHTLQTGQMFIIRPWQLHAIGNPLVGPSQLVWTMIDMGVRRPDSVWQWPSWFLWSDADAKQLTDYLALNDRSVFAASRETAESFGNLRDLIETASPAEAETRLKLLINMLMVAILDQMKADPPPMFEDFATSRKTVEVFLGRLAFALDRDWTLDDMAAECGLSRTRFAHYCALITNQTPIRFLRQLRLKQAASLIGREPHRSLTDIALSCGFGSSQYFSNAYKREFGVSPSQRGVPMGSTNMN
jgi:AraC family L-rhamnose operon regulatory protein RhaS